MRKEIKWQELHDEAVRVMKLAYAPYSDFPVGAAAQLEDGSIVSGCNVENCSYGLTICAENAMVAELVKKGGGVIVAFTCVNRDEQPMLPCGRCRQIIAEFGTADTILREPNGQLMTLDRALPGLVSKVIPKTLLEG